MPSKRKTIRHNVQALLSGQLGAAVGTRVLATRARAIQLDELPCVSVYTRIENAEKLNEAPREHRRTLKLVVEIAARADATLDDTLDDLAQLVEERLALDPTLSGVAHDTEIAETATDLAGEGENLVGVCAVTFDVTYDTLAPDDISAGLSPLETVQAGYDLAPADGTLEAEDTIDLPQPEEPEEEETP